jgi:glycerol 3-phosphatase-2
MRDRSWRSWAVSSTSARSGTGRRLSLVANASLLGSLALLGETLALARGLGLSTDVIYEVLAATPLAEQAARRREAIEVGEYPRRFALSLARKDAELIQAAAREAGAELRLLEATRSWIADAEAAGLADRDYTALVARILAAVPRRSQRGRASSGKPSRLDYDGLIVDLDGVVWLGGEPIEGAVEAVAALRARGIRLLFLTNDPSSSPAAQAARLMAIGIGASAEDVITSGSETVRFLAERSDLRGASAFIIGSPDFQEELANAGFELVPQGQAERAQIVVVGGHREFDFDELHAATRALASGAELFGAGRDRFVPTADGPEPATGAILAAVETASAVKATVVGKPEPFMFTSAAQALADCKHVAVVGDNLASDIAGARRAGLDAVLVLTGASGKGDLRGAKYAPDFVFASLDELAASICVGTRSEEEQ